MRIEKTKEREKREDEKREERREKREERREREREERGERREEREKRGEREERREKREERGERREETRERERERERELAHGLRSVGFERGFCGLPLLSCFGHAFVSAWECLSMKSVQSSGKRTRLCSKRRSRGWKICMPRCWRVLF